MKAIGLALMTAILVSIANIFQKIGAEKLPEIITNWPILLGILFYALGLIAFLYALREGQVTVVFPIVASSYIFVTVFALVILNEPVSMLRWVGVIVIFLGVTMIGVSKK